MPKRILTILVPVTLLLALGAFAWWLTADHGAHGSEAAAAASAEELHAPADLTAQGAPQARDDAAATAEAAQRMALPPAGAGWFLGRVVDEAGAPIAGATVSCWSGTRLDFSVGAFDPEALRGLQQQVRRRQQAQTDDDGRFRIAAPEGARDVRLAFRARGHLVLERRATVPDPIADVDLGTLTLRRGAVVAGRVVDHVGNGVAAAVVRRVAPLPAPRSGEPGMPVVFDLVLGEDAFGEISRRIGGDTGSEATTDSEGRFELVHVEPGEFDLLVHHDEHPRARTSGLRVEPGQTLTDVVVVLEPGAEIRGRVTGLPAGLTGVEVVAARAEGARSAAPGNPAPAVFLAGIANEVVESFGGGVERSAPVTSDGSFVLRGLQSGVTYRVAAVQSGPNTPRSPCTERREVPAGTTGLELRYESGVTVTFHVVDARTGAPVEDLFLGSFLRGGGARELVAGSINAMRGGSARRYPGGRVTLANLRPKKGETLSLSVEAIGHERVVRERIELPEAGSLDLGTLPLEPIPVVHVEVVSAVDGTPIAGAEVRLRGVERDAGSDGRRRGRGLAAGVRAIENALAGGPGPTGGRTDELGRCTLNSLPGKDVVVSVNAQEHAPYESEVLTLGSGDAHHRASLLRGGTVDVLVTNEDGSAAAEARVQHVPPFGPGQTRRAGEDGRTTFAHLAPGDHRFRVLRNRAAAGFAISFAGGGQRDANGPTEADFVTVTVADGGRTEVRLVLAAPAALSGIVREAGVPLVGARVSFVEGPGQAGSAGANAVPEFAAAAMEAVEWLGGGSRSARTGDDGRYRLAEVPAGEHRLRISHPSRARPAIVRVSLRPGDNVVDVDLDATVVRGTVRDPDGKPVAGAQVWVEAEGAGGSMPQVVGAMRAFDLAGGSSSGARTDADGRYEVRGVGSGRIVIRAQANGFAPGASATIDAGTGTVHERVDVMLVAAGSIEVRAAQEGGTFVSAYATFMGGSEGGATPPVVQPVRNGRATLEGLRPGRWSVRVIGFGQSPDRLQSKEVEVQAGRRVEVQF